MRIRFGLCGAVFAGVMALAACNLPGKPTPADVVKPPAERLDPVVLYKQNCAGCHGADGRLGPAPPIGDPVYLALVDDDTLRSTISKGRPGTAMSAFAQSEGGMLTSRQIDAIVRGIRQRWSKPDVLQSGTAPPYAAQSAGNPQQGAAVFKTSCASCHGADGKGTAKVGSIVDPNYLSLISNQGLRTIVIIGRPDFNAPDWRNNVPGHPMTDQEITDVVAWLAAQRPAGAAGQMAESAIASPAKAGSEEERGRLDAGLIHPISRKTGARWGPRLKASSSSTTTTSTNGGRQ